VRNASRGMKQTATKNITSRPYRLVRPPCEGTIKEHREKRVRENPRYRSENKKNTKVVAIMNHLREMYQGSWEG